MSHCTAAGLVSGSRWPPGWRWICTVVSTGGLTRSWAARSDPVERPPTSAGRPDERDRRREGCSRTSPAGRFCCESARLFVDACRWVWPAAPPHLRQRWTVLEDADQDSPCKHFANPPAAHDSITLDRTGVGAARTALYTLNSFYCLSVRQEVPACGVPADRAGAAGATGLTCGFGCQREWPGRRRRDPCKRIANGPTRRGAARRGQQPNGPCLRSRASTD